MLPSAVADQFCELLKPAAKLTHSAGLSASHFGGLPILDRDWPRIRNRPLSLLLVLDLGELAGIDIGFNLPASGVLNFFYDAERQPWGFEGFGSSAYAVIYTPEGTGRVAHAPAKTLVFIEVPIDLTQMLTHPQPDHVSIPDPEGDLESEYEMLDLQLSGPQSPVGCFHRIGGWPTVIQHPLPGIAFDDSESVVLLQLDSDLEAGWMWGDSGILYFLIDRRSLDNQDFSNTSVVLQCC
ncbi:DUF1963 domain-containing protein [Acidimicrobiaceae bacterium AH-315-P05]|nr:DUF1963 domain-containing protein [Acidimicrobiaceae bacterium AH-315-P05]